MSKKAKEAAVLNNKITAEIFPLKPDKLKLSPKAKATAERLKQATDSPDKGKIAAIDPESGDIFYGLDELEALEKGWEKYPEIIFYTVRIGYPSVGVLKSTRLQGGISHNKKIPEIQCCIQNKMIHFLSNPYANHEIFDFTVDTGFTETIMIPTQKIDDITITSRPWSSDISLAGGINQKVINFFSTIYVNSIIFPKIKIMAYEDEFLIGMDFMRQICKRTIFDFEKDKVIFED
jgi:hypothetical protein